MRKRFVSITFDDGPNRKYTPKILDILKRFGVRATFFLVGKNAKENPALVLRITREGHEIGNHTFSHPVSPIIRYGIIEKEICLTDKIIKGITGKKMRIFRPTWSLWDINSKKMLDITRRLGYLPVRWTVSSLDWLGIKKLIKGRVLNRYINPGEILLFHDGTEKSLVSKRDATVDLLPEFLCAAKRYSIYPIKLSDLFHLHAMKIL